MSTEQNKTIVRGWYEASLKGDLRACAEAMTPDSLHHLPGMPPLDVQALDRMIGAFIAAFPDLHGHIEDMLAEGDWVVLRSWWGGTHQGNLMGIPPAGHTVKVEDLNFFHLKNGKIIEHWSNFDQLGMMQQLGVIPTPG